MLEENIIQIRKRNIDEANKAFADFMKETEAHFNKESKTSPELFRKISPFDLEKHTEKVLKEIACHTPFRPEEIKLVSGHSFPDVMAEKYFGVEVKSTKENHWTSTGSSIVESTRDEFVENIYMLFGKLGGNPPEFKCRPYADCLYNVAVTHSPRYLIDMELKDKKQETIFDKMHVSYDDFRQDANKIEKIRDYYVREAVKSGKEEMPWWVGRQSLTDKEEIITPSISLFRNSVEKTKYVAEAFILFPEVINGMYANAALWLCTHKYLLCLNMRDEFSAGGQIKKINGKSLDVTIPRVVKTVMESLPIIKDIFYFKKSIDLYEFHPEYLTCSNAYEKWLDEVEMRIRDLKCGKNRNIPFPKEYKVRKWLENPDKFEMSLK